MAMTSGLRKFALTLHVISSVGWLGAVVSFLALTIVGLVSNDVQLVRAVYLAMDLIVWLVIVPLAIVSLVSGLVQSLGTSWGLFRHYWVLVKFVLTIFATIILLLKTQLVTALATVAANINLTDADLGGLRSPELLVHSIGGVMVLLFVTVLSVYKPWGLTAYGRRKQTERRQVQVAEPTLSNLDPETKIGKKPEFRTPRWAYVVGIHAVGLALLFLIMHLHGGMRGH